MIDDEIRAAVTLLRSVAAPVGPLHSHWDLIIDAEQLLAGRQTFLTREEIVELLKEATA